MKKYIEFVDGKTRSDYYSAVDDLNDFISKNELSNVRVVSYQVVRYERINAYRTYILVEVEE